MLKIQQKKRKIPRTITHTLSNSISMQTCTHHKGNPLYTVNAVMHHSHSQRFFFAPINFPPNSPSKPHQHNTTHITTFPHSLSFSFSFSSHSLTIATNENSSLLHFNPHQTTVHNPRSNHQTRAKDGENDEHAPVAIIILIVVATIVEESWEEMERVPRNEQLGRFIGPIGREPSR